MAADIQQHCTADDPFLADLGVLCNYMEGGRSEIELDLVSDPLLAQVGWTWLVDALSAHGAVYTAVSGTVTRVATESFGGMAEDGGTAQVEVRASWTPLPTEAGTLRDGRPVAPTTALAAIPRGPL